MTILRGTIGVIGDVHAEDALLESALDRLSGLGATAILCCGDLSDGQGDLDRCCELLASAGVLTVRGNHDRWLAADTMRSLPHAQTRAALARRTVAFLEALPPTRAFTCPLGGALLCHGLGEDDMSSVREDDMGYALEMNFALQDLLATPRLDLVINGHTHRPLVRALGGLTILNAGTLARRDAPGFVTANLETGDVEWNALSRDSDDRRLGTIPARPVL